MNINNYKPTTQLTKEQLKDNNFKYTDGMYSYRFSVYKYRKEPTLWCDFVIDLESGSCRLNVIDQNNNTYAPFFNKKYNSSNKVVDDIEKRIKSQISIFVKNNIIKTKRKGDE